MKQIVPDRKDMITLSDYHAYQHNYASMGQIVAAEVNNDLFVGKYNEFHLHFWDGVFDNKRSINMDYTDFLNDLNNKVNNNVRVWVFDNKDEFIDFANKWETEHNYAGLGKCYHNRPIKKNLF